MPIVSQLKQIIEDRLRTLNPQHHLSHWSDFSLTDTHILYTQTHTPPESQLQLPGRPPYQGSDPGGLGLFFNPTPSPRKAGEMAAVGQLFLPGSRP